MFFELTAEQRHSISEYLGIDELELEVCPATLKPVKSPGTLTFEYVLTFNSAVPCDIWSDIEDGYFVRIPAWVIDEHKQT